MSFLGHSRYRYCSWLCASWPVHSKITQSNKAGSQQAWGVVATVMYPHIARAQHLLTYLACVVLYVRHRIPSLQSMILLANPLGLNGQRLLRDISAGLRTGDQIIWCWERKGLFSWICNNKQTILKTMSRQVSFSCLVLFHVCLTRFFYFRGYLIKQWQVD